MAARGVLEARNAGRGSEGEQLIDVRVGLAPPVEHRRDEPYFGARLTAAQAYQWRDALSAALKEGE